MGLFYNSYYVNIAWEGKFFGGGFWVGGEKRVTKLARNWLLEALGKTMTKNFPCAVGVRCVGATKREFVAIAKNGFVAKRGRECLLFKRMINL